MQQKGFWESAYKVDWKPEGAPSKEEGFGASAYKVDWKPKDACSKEKGVGASAYKVDWKSEDAPSEEKGFGESAYKVDWKQEDASSKQKGFGASAYKVDWKPEGACSREEGFGASAYKVDWKPEDARSKGKGFGESAYKVDWKSEDAPSEEKGFGESAYKVDWKLEDSTSKKNNFDGSAYVVHWDPDHAHSSSSIPEELEKRRHVKFQTGMLFLKKNLHIGTTLPEGTMFARDGAPKSIHFSSTPLESKYLPTILSYFKLPHGSMKAKQVADTLHSCGKPADKVEPHMCFSSREAMARFATRELGVSGARVAITRIHGHENPSSMYVVEHITQLNSNLVPCHPMDFPYEVFYCHRPKLVQSLRVQLKDLKDDMSRVTTIAMCHMNTSDWDTRYFELLDGERGEPICHYMPTDYVMFY
ncbi:BURP domain-containing protein 4-like [Triticum dicoccoides]|uniref:BURP domain-containing protein 4-like n=1 Tax=Triticum dicoccoides TaxID=85692 RepID=UPI001890D620|nr:BURP domain-containing protein 4-like [Triticum dicoccoides]